MHDFLVPVKDADENEQTFREFETESSAHILGILFRMF